MESKLRKDHPSADDGTERGTRARGVSGLRVARDRAERNDSQGGRRPKSKFLELRRSRNSQLRLVTPPARLQSTRPGCLSSPQSQNPPIPLLAPAAPVLGCQRRMRFASPSPPPTPNARSALKQLRTPKPTGRYGLDLKRDWEDDDSSDDDVEGEDGSSDEANSSDEENRDRGISSRLENGRRPM